VTARARSGRAGAPAVILAVLLAGLALAGAARAGAPAPAGTVTFLAGEATRSAAGGAERLAIGAAVHAGDVIETAGRTRLEVRLADRSLLRLGPRSRAVVERAVFGATAEDRKVSAKLLVGQVWANVAKAVGGEARFEVRTENAVAGVRGTTFRVDASADRSVVVKVYSGTVAVAAGPVPRPAHQGPKPQRRQIEGPAEVTREEWERIVGAMMQLRVGADGVPGVPERFEPQGADAWERWNRERDAAAR